MEKNISFVPDVMQTPIKRSENLKKRTVKGQSIPLRVQIPPMRKLVKWRGGRDSNPLVRSQLLLISNPYGTAAYAQPATQDAAFRAAPFIERTR